MNPEDRELNLVSRGGFKEGLRDGTGLAVSERTHKSGCDRSSAQAPLHPGPCARVSGSTETTHLQVSYMILQRVSPVTHSIGNCLKRVIVIVASVVVFQNPMSQRNILGTPDTSCGARTRHAHGAPHQAELDAGLRNASSLVHLLSSILGTSCPEPSILNPKPARGREPVADAD